MNEEYSFSELREMAADFKEMNMAMSLRIEVIKELCDQSNIDWRAVGLYRLINGTSALRWLAENPDEIPNSKFYFKRMIAEYFDVHARLQEI